MSQWYVLGSGDGTDPQPLVDKTILVELSNGKDRALGFLVGFAYVPATVQNGLPYPAKVNAVVRSFIPLTPNTASLAFREIFDVYHGQQFALLPKDAKLRLRYVDQRGVPWWIEGVAENTAKGSYQPQEGFDKNAIAWTSHYGGDDGVALEADTLDDLKAKIRKVQNSQFRNPPPAFSADTALRDDQGPLVVPDEGGDFQLHGADFKNKYSIWAVRSNAFQTDVVGPAASLGQIKADVDAFRDDLAKAPALGLFDASGRTTSGLSVDAAENESPPASDVASTPWGTYAVVALLGVAAYAAVQAKRENA